ncbi:MAG: apolipoprotein N-acyltransferase [Halobacteriovoraceae bacterium]|nr:apolipoprotein N-acyltransferase [Halobacteriovoraceae bacterium]MCB9095641.1 apolipoprotein N-acyltransferase [Halobacteriovoraceae bacterium]
MNIKRYILSFLGGFIFCFGHPSFISEYGFLGFTALGLAVVYSQIRFQKILTDLLCVFFFCLSISVFAFYWIPKTLSVFGEIPYSFSYLLFFLFAIIVIPQFWIQYLILTPKRIHQNSLIIKIKNEKSCLYLLLAFLFTLIGYYTPSQFPVQVGQPWLYLPVLLGFAPIGGLPFFSFLSYLLAFIIYEYLKNKKWVPSLSFLFIFLTLLSTALKPWSFGEKTLTNIDHNSNYYVRIVQADIGNFMKVQSELGQFTSMQNVFDRYYSLSMKDTQLPKLDLIIWPETAYPIDFNTDLLEQGLLLPNMFRRIIDKHQSEMYIGAYDIGKLDKSANGIKNVYNSAIHFSREGKYLNVYHKHLLIPFGESLPFGELNQTIKEYIPGISFFSQGYTYPVFESDNQISFIGAICYEMLSSNYIREYLNDANTQGKFPRIMINLTNDSWYGKTAEPYQHLFLAKWRAVENQIPFIRATNSGISSVIDIDGKESQRLMLGEKEVLDLSLFLPERTPTIFQRFGFLAFSCLFILTFFLDVILRKTLFSRKPFLQEIVKPNDS